MGIDTGITSNESRWMSHVLVNTGQGRMVPNPALNQGEALDEHPEADIATEDRRLTSAAPFVMDLPLR